MADEELLRHFFQLQFSKAGAWNNWRKEHPNTIIDFSGAKFAEMVSAAHLFDVDLSYAFLHDANFSHANLSRANLSYVDGWNVNFRNATLDGANLNHARLDRADFLAGSLLGVNLWGARLDSANFRGAKAAGSNLNQADVTFANFSDAKLSEADFSYARAVSADFTRAHLNEADFRRSDIRGSKFVGASLANVDFADATAGGTQFCEVDLRYVLGLETVKHRGPSTLGIDTIFLSENRIDERFLRGCGIPEIFVVYANSLITKGIDFYSCFISYSSKDQHFASRLHTDLHDKGVRCWFAPEDLKIGDRFRDRIDESIRVHDKLLIILSENSVSSPWVRDEVEAAFERENREGRTVLFPIRIDEAITESRKAWAATIRRTCQIGDFTHWEEHASYQKAFERLLRDLRAKE